MNHIEQDPPQNDQFSRGIGISFAAHALLISFFTLKAVFFTQEPIDFTQAVRVDIVGLPDKIEEKDLAPPAPKPAEPEKPVAKPEPVKEKAPEKKPEPKPELPKQQPKKDDAVNLEKNKAKQDNALDKLKAMAALEKIKNDVAKESSKPAPEPAKTVKGNLVSPGTSLTGLTKLQHETYGADLDRHIKQHWSLPEWLAKRDLKAQARVFIDTRGNILDRKIVKSSGNPSYDEEVLATIDRAAPFPAPPDKFQALVSVDGILIGFPE